MSSTAPDPGAGSASPGLTDPFGRVIDYLRVSVTDRCNLRCTYCVTSGAFRQKPRETILSYEEIAAVVRAAVGLGIGKVRLTGGEPLVRKDLPRLVEMVSGLPGLSDLALTTNGILLDRQARTLKAAGLGRVNISLDSLSPELYRSITGGGELSQALRGIDAALEAGLKPVKLNCVLLPGVNDPDTVRIPRFARERGMEVQFIKRMHPDREKPSLPENPIAGRPPDCKSCNRLRLTADGKLRPCLFSAYAVPLRPRSGNLEEAIREAVRNKPERGNRLQLKSMMEVGG